MITREDFIARLAALGLEPADVTERCARSSGPGGQHVNKTSTAVTLLCAKRDLRVTAQDSRSQSANRRLAWERLLGKLEAARTAQRDAARQAREKERRQKRKRPRGLKERILETKRRRSQTKSLRRVVPE